jgi:hypothetical protein
VAADFNSACARSQQPGLTLDVSRMRFDDGFLDRMAQPMQRAFELA